jgi:hypothetical protein
MAWNPGLTRLRDLLAELYPTIQLSREVVEQAGLPTGHIEFSTASSSNWHQILKEADLRKRVPAVVAIARQEYPERAPELTAAEQVHLGYAGQAAGAAQGSGEADTPASAPKYSISMPGATGVAIGDGATVVQHLGPVGGAGPESSGREPQLSVMHELLLAAFTPGDLVRLFRYTPNAALRPVVNRFGPSDGLSTLADKALTFCEKQGLLLDLLEEVKRENPRQYARFESRLWGGEAGAPDTPAFSAAEQRDMLQQELAQHQRNLARLRSQKAIYAAGEEPLRLLNQIDQEQAEIQRLQAELDALL